MASSNPSPPGRAPTGLSGPEPRTWDAAVFTASHAVAGGLSLAYIIVAGRLLDDKQFGIATALIGIIAVFGYLAGAVQNAVAQRVAEAHDVARIAALQRRLWRAASGWCVVAMPIAILLLAPIGANAGAVLATGTAIATMVAGAVSTGRLAGHGDLRGQALVGFAGAAVRLVTGAALISAGMGVSGAVAAYFAGNIAIIALGSRRNERPGAAAADPQHHAALRLETRSLAAFVAAFTPFALDQWLVQTLTPAVGGHYAAFTTIAKMVFFAAAPVAMIAFPRMLKATSHAERLAILGRAGAMTLAVCVGIGAALMLAPATLVDALFAGRYADAHRHLATLVPGTILFSLSIFLVHALVAWRVRGLLPALLAPPAVGLILFLLRHDSLTAMTENLALTYGLQFILLSVATLCFVTRGSARDDTA